ncbi:hypothetical protein D3C76_1627920 [compost metagenome]
MAPTRSGHSAQKLEAGPYTKKPQRNNATRPVALWGARVHIHKLVAAPRNM